MRKNRKFSMIRCLCLSLAVFFALMTAGCSDDDDSLTGVFEDSPVKGLNYETPTHSGLTGSGGIFEYAEGETVTFSLGGLEIGSAVGAKKITPADLVPGAQGDVTNQKVTNICVFLQSLDTDGDPRKDGIDISSVARELVKSENMTVAVFDQSSEEFATVVQDLLDTLNVSGEDLRKRVTPKQAQFHLRQTLIAEAWTGDKTVKTMYGAVRAGDDDGDTLVWKAIPYAKPPVDELRWKAPQDPDSWEGAREETEYCDLCPQYNTSPWPPKDVDQYSDANIPVVGNEDCLYLNIWRPRSGKRDLPVYFWLHGGGNSIGTASTDDYNGANIASLSDMVVVTANYRLGPLGWFAHPALRNGDEIDDSGNYGTLDTMKALEWVRNNIEVFGGDHENITVAGESAGAINTLSLIISPLARDLFHKGVLQSPLRNTIYSFEQGEASADAVIMQLLINDGTAEAGTYMAGMSDAETEDYLRSKSSEELLKCYALPAYGMLNFPYIFGDGTVIPETGYDTITEGTYPNKVPLIMGSNKEENKLFFARLLPMLGNETYAVLTKFSSDRWKASAIDSMARDLRSNEDQPDIYVYQFNWGAPGEDGKSVIPDPEGFLYGACHGQEIDFFFAHDTIFSYAYTDENRLGMESLSDAIMAYVAQFARTGNPNAQSSHLTEWTPWSNSDAADASKCIQFDADYDVVNIEMSSEELTPESVREAFAAAVPEDVYTFLVNTFFGGNF